MVRMRIASTPSGRGGYAKPQPLSTLGILDCHFSETRLEIIIWRRHERHARSSSGSRSKCAVMTGMREGGVGVATSSPQKERQDAHPALARKRAAHSRKPTREHERHRAAAHFLGGGAAKECLHKNLSFRAPDVRFLPFPQLYSLLPSKLEFSQREPSAQMRPLYRHATSDETI